MNGVVSTVRDTVRTQLWPLPLLGVVLAVALGVGLPLVDEQVDGSLPLVLSQLIFGGDADAARSVLSGVSGSLITVTSLTFSLTVVTLQLASSQFSPRLLRTFTSDLFVQVTLALFLTTFTYALTVLRTVRGGGDTFVPRISVTLSFVLAVASVVGLVLFLAHLAAQIRVETMLRDVHQDATATVTAVLEERREPQDRTPLPVPSADAVWVYATGSGFVTGLRLSALRSAAQEADVTLVLDKHPGCSVVEGVPIGRAWSARGPLDDDAVETLRRRVGSAVGVGPERTAAQDIAYGLRQLTDVTNKALSPGINDPTTAVHALGHVSTLLCQLADRETGAQLLRDDGVGEQPGRVRVVVHRPELAELVDVAIAQPRRYGASDPQVLDRLFELLGELAWRAHDDQTDIVRHQLARLRETAEAQDFDTAERAMLRASGRRVEEALAHVGHAAPDGRS
ncbi:DUF2254 domain-containing protein [Rhodococcus aerolatus]